MNFKGQLLLPGDDGPGLSVNLDVAEHHLAVESDGGGLGAWPLEVVDVERLEGDVFALTVAGEPLRFVASDTVAFAYSGVPVIERFSGRSRARSGFRSLLERIWAAPSQTAAPTKEPPPPSRGAHRREIVEPPAVEPESTSVAESAEVPDEAAVESRADQEVAKPTIEPVRGDVTEPSPSVEEASSAQCPAVRSDGRQCESTILTSSGFCYPHDPRRAFDDKYQAAQEARAQMRREATGRLNRVYSRLDKALRQVERGELDPETAMAMAQLARTMCAILDVESPPPGKDDR